MLKKRVIGVVLVRSGIVVQSIGFKRYLPIGKPKIAIHYLDRWGVDEIVVLHIDASQNHYHLSSDDISAYARGCQVPLSVGGGIKTLEDVRRIIRAGADKVVINAGLIQQQEMVRQAVDLFGQQSVVASIDAKREADGYQAYLMSGQKATGMSVVALAKMAEQLGAGELLLTSIDRDGSQLGYDLELIRAMSTEVSIPVIACGGAGHPLHLQAAMQEGALAVAVGNMFHFTEHSVTLTKRSLKMLEAPVRLDSYVNYQNFNLTEWGRVARLSDAALDALRFQYIAEEEI